MITVSVSSLFNVQCSSILTQLFIVWILPQCFNLFHNLASLLFINTLHIPLLMVAQPIGLSVYKVLLLVYNLRKFNGFNNCTFWSIIVVITLGKCAHLTPSGVRERQTCIGLMKSTNVKLPVQHQFHSWTSVALNMCVLSTTFINTALSL
jgi:hypothetical protein